VRNIIFVLMFLSFSACTKEATETEEGDVCHRDFECREYPTWETWDSRNGGYFQSECVPCWYEYRRVLMGQCCTCNPDTNHNWCNEDGDGFYHCSPSGEFDALSCGGYCARFGYPYGDRCIMVDGEAECDCRFVY